MIIKYDDVTKTIVITPKDKATQGVLTHQAFEIKALTDDRYEKLRQEVENWFKVEKSHCHNALGALAFVDDPLQCFPLCGLDTCSRLLYGIITRGMQCPVCKVTYHDECYTAGKSKEGY